MNETKKKYLYQLCMCVCVCVVRALKCYKSSAGHLIVTIYVMAICILSCYVNGGQETYSMKEMDLCANDPKVKCAYLKIIF